MSSKTWRKNSNISMSSIILKDFNYNKTNLTYSNDEMIIIWYDISIKLDEQDDQYTINQLNLINKKILICTTEDKCFEYLNKYKIKNKIILIVSGSIGKEFVPKISFFLQIYFIFIFCGSIAKHQLWAKKYKKIYGVYNNIHDLCQNLQDVIEKFENYKIFQNFIDTLSIKESNNILNNLKSTKNDEQYQFQDNIKISILSDEISFSKTIIGSSTINNNDIIQSSKTVTPYIQYKQQMEFSDTGIWPCVSIIDNDRSELFNYLNSSIEIVKYFNTIDHFIEHINNHLIDPHFIIISNPINIEQIQKLFHHLVRKIYIYCSNNRLNEYDKWNKNYSNILTVLQYFHTLTRLILWDLSACIIDIGNYYDSENKKILAQTRYRYAYRLHCIIQGQLNNRIEMIESNKSIKFNN